MPRRVSASAKPAVRSIATGVHVPSNDEANHGGWYGRKAERARVFHEGEARGEARRAAEAGERAEAARRYHLDEVRRKSITALVCAGLVAVAGYGVVDTIDLNRRINGYDPASTGVHACQDGYGLATCVPARIGDGTEWRMLRLDTRGELATADGLRSEGRVEIPVLGEGGSISYSQANWTRRVKGGYDLNMAVPAGAQVPFMAADGTVAIAPAAGRSIDLGQARTLSETPVLGQTLDADRITRAAGAPGR